MAHRGPMTRPRAVVVWASPVRGGRAGALCIGQSGGEGFVDEGAAAAEQGALLDTGDAGGDRMHGSGRVSDADLGVLADGLVVVREAQTRHVIGGKNKWWFGDGVVQPRSGLELGLGPGERADGQLVLVVAVPLDVVRAEPHDRG
jgi:hypothetical protein